MKKQNVAGGSPYRRRRSLGMKKRTAVGIFAVLGIALAMTAGAALLTYYGTVETTVTAEQSVQIKAGGGDIWHNWNEPITNFVIPEAAPGGESFCFKLWVWDRASVEAPIWFETTVEDESGFVGPGEGVTATVFEFPEAPITLVLDNKDDNWDRLTGDDIEATLTFNPVSTTFEYDLTVIGLEPEKEYALIYYQDQNPRFDTWGGADGIIITTFTTDVLTGNYIATGQSVDLNRNMPDGDDWNMHPGTTYQGAPDNYVHWQGGAKLWIVPTADLTNEDSLPLVAWNPGQYLFETDLISYSDCNLQVVPWTMSLWGTEVIDTIIQSGDQVPFFVCYAFDIAIMPGTYTMTTYVSTHEV